MLASFGFFGANNQTRGEELGSEKLGELDTLSVFPGHWESEDIDRTGAEPRFDRIDLIFHV